MTNCDSFFGLLHPSVSNNQGQTWFSRRSLWHTLTRYVSSELVYAL